jgi:hypothetical protein
MWKVPRKDIRDYDHLDELASVFTSAIVHDLLDRVSGATASINASAEFPRMA